MGFDSYLHFQCDMVGECFTLSAKKGWDSLDFVEKFLTTERGIEILKDLRPIEYSDSLFMFEGFMQTVDFKPGPMYDDDVLWFAGYLYRYWVATRKIDPRKIQKISPIKLIADRYYFYHTQDFDYVINDIIERPATVIGG